MTTPPRRQTRASTRGNDTPAPVRSTPAPATSRRRRRTELESLLGDNDGNTMPPIPLGINHAYGAPGVPVNLGAQIQGQPVPFAAGFDAARAQAAGQPAQRSPERAARPSRQASRAPSMATNPAARTSQRNTRAPGAIAGDAIAEADEQQARADNDDDDDDDDDYVQVEVEEEEEEVAATQTRTLRRTSPREPAQQPQTGANDATSTAIDTDMSYVAPSELRRYNNIRNARIAARLNPQPTVDEIEAARPSRFEAIRETAREWWNDDEQTYVRGGLFLVLVSPFVFIALLFLSKHVLVPVGIDIPGTFYELMDTIEHQAQIALNNSQQKTLFDPSVTARIDNIETDVKKLQFQWTEIKDMLPDQFIVSKNPTTGTYDIPPAFWTAIESRLKTEFQPSPPDSGAAPAWDTFLKDNQRRIDAMLANSADHAVDSHIKTLRRDGHIVSKDTFVAALQEQTAKLRKEMAIFRTEAIRSAERAASAKASEHPSRPGPAETAPQYLEDITLLILARNHLLARERNFLSPALGAVIDPNLSSPTYDPSQPNLLASLWASWSPWSSVPGPNPPTAALLPWTEAGECWCAAISDHPGRAQLTALLVGPVDPSSLVVEHVPALSTLDIASAPRDLEVWGLPSDDPDLPMQPHPSSLTPEASRTDCTGPPPPSDNNGNNNNKGPRPWICLGRAHYDLHAQNWVQTFPLDGRGAMVDKIVVRVLGNWGGEKTCIYRLRLLGRTEDEVRWKMGMI